METQFVAIIVCHCWHIWLVLLDLWLIIDIICGRYIYLYVIDTHQLLDQCDLYFRNGSIFDFSYFFNYIRSDVQRKVNFGPLLYLSTVHILTNTLGSLTCIKKLAAISVFHAKFVELPSLANQSCAHETRVGSTEGILLNSFWFIMVCLCLVLVNNP